jgi:hypothetical protein
LGVVQTNNGGAALRAHALAAEVFVVTLVHALRRGEGSRATRTRAVLTILLAGGLQDFLASAANAVHAEFSVVFQDVASAIHEGFGAVGAHAVLAERFVSVLDNVGIILREYSSALRAHASVAERRCILEDKLHRVEGIGAAVAHAVGAVPVRHLPACVGFLAPHAKTPLVEVFVALLHSGSVVLERSCAITAHAINAIFLSTDVNGHGFVERSLAPSANAPLVEGGGAFADARVVEGSATLAAHTVAAVSLRVVIYEVATNNNLLAPCAQTVGTVFVAVLFFVSTLVEGVVTIIAHAIRTKLSIGSVYEIFERGGVAARRAQAVVAIVHAVHLLELSVLQSLVASSTDTIWAKLLVSNIVGLVGR